MTKRLKDKNILVTAAGQGIGKATAIAFHKEGANVIATDINDKTLEDLNKEYPNIKIQKLIKQNQLRPDNGQSSTYHNILYNHDK